MANVFLAKEHREQQQVYLDNSLRMAPLVYVQCNSAIQSKIKDTMDMTPDHTCNVDADSFVKVMHRN